MIRLRRAMRSLAFRHIPCVRRDGTSWAWISWIYQSSQTSFSSSSCHLLQPVPLFSLHVNAGQ